MQAFVLEKERGGKIETRKCSACCGVDRIGFSSDVY
jgi:hypothetical protein